MDVGDLDCTGATATQDLVLNPPIFLVSPADEADVSTTTPEFVWDDYSTLAGTLPSGAWSYGVFYTEALTGAAPSNLWGLPNDVTSFDLSDPPTGTDKVDAGFIVSCAEDGGSVNSGGTCAGGTGTVSGLTLPGSTTIYWGVAVIECDYDDYVNDTDDDTNNIDDYTDCLTVLGASDDDPYAFSEIRQLTTP